MQRHYVMVRHPQKRSSLVGLGNRKGLLTLDAKFVSSDQNFAFSVNIILKTDPPYLSLFTRNITFLSRGVARHCRATKLGLV
jgi:hypothetical protein